jgi:hypothetical protein
MENSPVTYISVGEHEPGSLIILLLIDNTVQTDDAAFEPPHSYLPKVIAVAAPAQFRLHYIETHKAEGEPVGDDRNATNRFTIEASH